MKTGMQRLIHTLGLAAALTAVVVSVWRDYGLLVALKRVAVSYLAVFFVASLLVLGYKLVVLLGADAETPAEPEPAEPEGQVSG